MTYIMIHYPRGMEPILGSDFLSMEVSIVGNDVFNQII